MKQKQLIYGILAVITSLVMMISGCAGNKTNSQPFQLSVNYHYTTEGSYFDSDITNSKLVYTHVDYEKIKEKCAKWMTQSPCWTQDDLITEEAMLTNTEVEDLRKLIGETKILELNDYYGPERSLRCYPYTLTIQLDNVEKEITYCNRPDGPAEPEASKLVSQRITELVNQKFPR